MDNDLFEKGLEMRKGTSFWKNTPGAPTARKR